jgi:hypothetical protein
MRLFHQVFNVLVEFGPITSGLSAIRQLCHRFHETSVLLVIRQESNLASADVDEHIGIVRKLRLRIRRGTG